MRVNDVQPVVSSDVCIIASVMHPEAKASMRSREGATRRGFRRDDQAERLIQGSPNHSQAGAAVESRANDA